MALGVAENAPKAAARNRSGHSAKFQQLPHDQEHDKSAIGVHGYQPRRLRLHSSGKRSGLRLRRRVRNHIANHASSGTNWTGLVWTLAHYPERQDTLQITEIELDLA